MTLGLWGTGSVVVAHGLRCPVACGFFVPRPATGPVSAALTGRFLTAGPSGMSLVQDLWQGDSGFQSVSFIDNRDCVAWRNRQKFWIPISIASQPFG